MDKELVDEWLRFANMDLEIAKNSLRTMQPAPLEIICYHCQQAAEKFLKSVIVSYGAEVEKTHDLTKLLDALKEFIDVPEQFLDSAEILTLFGVRARYPLAIDVDESQTKNAIFQAEKIKTWTENIIAQNQNQ